MTRFAFIFGIKKAELRECCDCGKDARTAQQPVAGTERFIQALSFKFKVQKTFNVSHYKQRVLGQN